MPQSNEMFTNFENNTVVSLACNINQQMYTSCIC